MSALAEQRQWTEEAYLEFERSSVEKHEFMDGQVLALGGLFRDSKSFGKNGLPILSRIPVLGSLLFGNSRDMQQRTELIILLKPHVVRSPDDGRAITEELRGKIRTLEPFRTQGRIP